ncbi:MULTISPECIES: restriction endonuclease subunit S [Rahnella]|uniref:restriction endonuclease subunit S n=1 Tax=Rahnella TaxID=34037 RepID=UPI001045EFC1|nr:MULTISPECIES: restriction endonuclease subunit S [Rahnella]TCQ85159.1 type I restriction enzyme S subunit [Rahnella sp. JUb53]
MSGRYKAYGEYKDSGVEWLGEIPKSWKAKRLAAFFEERREKVSDKDYSPLSVTMKGIVPQLENAAKTEAGNNRKLVLKNDFVINSRSDRKGSSGVSSLVGSVSLISIVMVPTRIYPYFAHHLLRSYSFQEEFYRYGKGIVADLWSTNSSEMKNILIPEVPMREQEAIAAFLDHETAKIDTLIDKQQQLIELLKEKRQAVISHAVTKGLDPDVPMKDSGVEWLGEVPEHWDVIQLKYITSMSSEKIKNINDRYVGMENISSGNGKYIFKEEVVSDGISVSFNQGDVLFGKLRPYLAKSWVADFSGVCSSEFLVLRALKVSPYFLNYYLLTNDFIEQVNSSTYGSKMPRASWDFIGLLSVPICSYKTSEIIALYLDKITLKIDTLIELQLLQIELLKERRTALISAAVTGKIDVRDWQVPVTQTESDEVMA